MIVLIIKMAWASVTKDMSTSDSHGRPEEVHYESNSLTNGDGDGENLRSTSDSHGRPEEVHYESNSLTNGDGDGENLRFPQQCEDDPYGFNATMVIGHTAAPLRWCRPFNLPFSAYTDVPQPSRHVTANERGNEVADQVLPVATPPQSPEDQSPTRAPPVRPSLTLTATKMENEVAEEVLQVAPKPQSPIRAPAVTANDIASAPIPTRPSPKKGKGIEPLGVLLQACQGGGSVPVQAMGSDEDEAAKGRRFKRGRKDTRRRRRRGQRRNSH
ncbi:uncharacterized protein LOC134454695 [Engraulis encrasicolus]|uniref:uncharacterized protein LOC134454695 n=1 Tax=Engraulis encrasicolus TaxID=184585 RepID=UPI002FD3FBD5